MIKILNDIEKKVATSATSELFKIAFFIGFIPCVIALLCDFGLLKVIFIDLNTSKDFKVFDSVMKTLIPNDSIYMNILSFYTISQMILLYILGFCVHLKKKVFPRILWFCEFFSPVAEILLQLLAVISGVFLAVALLMIFSTEPYSSIIFFVISLFIFFLSVAALTINRVITHNYQNL